MSDIFISYAREDAARIQNVAYALRQRGWSVFWDRHIPAGQTWRSYIGQALSDARCVIVAWSRHSVSSRWVIEEAEEGQKRGVLVPVLLDAIEPPIGFRGIQAGDLTDWSSNHSSPRFDQLVRDIQVILGGTQTTAKTARHVEPEADMPSPLNQRVKREPKFPFRRLGFPFMFVLLALAVGSSYWGYQGWLGNGEASRERGPTERETEPNDEPSQETRQTKSETNIQLKPSTSLELSKQDAQSASTTTDTENIGSVSKQAKQAVTAQLEESETKPFDSSLFEDSFERSRLSNAWEIVNHDPDRFMISDGKVLSVTTSPPKNFVMLNHPITRNFVASIEVTMNVGWKSDAGLYYWVDDENFVFVAVGHWDGAGPKMHFVKTLNGEWNDIDGGTIERQLGVHAKEPTLYLQLERIGVKFKGRMSTDGTSWTDIGTHGFLKKDAGRLGFRAGSKRTEYPAEFDNFVLKITP